WRTVGVSCFHTTFMISSSCWVSVGFFMLVLRRDFFRAVYHQDLDRTLPRFQSEAELFLNRCIEGGASDVTVRRRTDVFRSPFQAHIEKAFEIRFVQHGLTLE